MHGGRTTESVILGGVGVMLQGDTFVARRHSPM